MMYDLFRFEKKEEKTEKNILEKTNYRKSFVKTFQFEIYFLKSRLFVLFY